MDSCKRRSANGLITLNRPTIISEYNKHMGGVDLADMRRLHCNSTIMGQHRWWLKLFFYLLDVGTSNSLVLFREATDEHLNLFQFKYRLVSQLQGERIIPIAGSLDVPEVHELVKAGDHRHLCTYCVLMGRKPLRRTRYKCRVCNLPLCAVGNGKVEDDCFAKSHGNNDLHMACIEKQKAMQLNTNSRGK
jgi:hypothetical protein